MKHGFAAVVMASLTGLMMSCNTPTQEQEPTLRPEATSLLGEPLFAPTMPDEVLLQRSTDLNKAHRAYLADPDDETTTIWFGRRLAYLGRYGDAIDRFTEGLANHPDSYRLLRHRGHRYVTLRRFDDAITDLDRAAALTAGLPDAIEQDGQPNARNIPRSTTQTNIYYHLGLAHYLKGEWEASRRAYATCLELSDNDDMRVAAAYWLYLNLRRLGLPQVAASILNDIEPEMDVIENDGYHRLLLIFKGALDPEMEQADDEGDGVQDATFAYGLAIWTMLEGDREEAIRRFRAIVDAGSWGAFGHIAAEAELARLAHWDPSSVDVGDPS